MPTTRSAALGRAVLPAGGWITLFQVPANEIYLVKSAYVSANGPSAEVILAVVNNASQTNIRLAQWSVSANDGDSWQGWIVVEPGDLVQATASVAGVSIWVSGAALPGVYEPLRVTQLPGHGYLVERGGATEVTGLRRGR